MKQGMIRMSRVALVGFAVAFLVAAGGYHVGKELAHRDNTRQAVN